MQACGDWVLRIIGIQVTKKKWPVWSSFPDYLSVSYDYACNIISKANLLLLFKDISFRNHLLLKRNPWYGICICNLFFPFELKGFVLLWYSPFCDYESFNFKIYCITLGRTRRGKGDFKYDLLNHNYSKQGTLWTSR